MNYKGIIVAGAIAIGLYLFSKTKKISDKEAIRKAAAQKIGKKIGKKVAQKVDISEIPVQLLRYTIAHMPAQMKTGKEMAALKAEVARREAVWLAAHKAAIRKAAAQKIGKKIGKTVAQKMSQAIKARRALMAQHAKRQRPRIQRPRPTKKQIASRLFSGAEKSRIIPYSESSKHSYYGPKSRKLQNEGYRVESNKRIADSVEANYDKVRMEVLSNPKLWKK